MYWRAPKRSHDPGRSALTTGRLPRPAKDHKTRTSKYSENPRVPAHRVPAAQSSNRPWGRPTRHVPECRISARENTAAGLPLAGPTCRGPCQLSAIAPAHCPLPCPQDGRTSGSCQRLRMAMWLLLFVVDVTCGRKQTQPECVRAAEILFRSLNRFQSFVVKVAARLRHLAQHFVKMPALGNTLARRLIEQF